MALGDIHLRFAWQAWHLRHFCISPPSPPPPPPVCHTQLCHTPSFTPNFVTHHLSNPSLSHTIFHSQLCHTQLCHTHNFVTQHLSHHNFVTPSFVTPNFVTHHLSHTQLCHTLSHAIFHIKFCHTQLFTYNLFYFSVLLHLLCLSFLPRPATTFVPHCRKKLTCGVIRPFNLFINIYICIYMIYYLYLYVYIYI